MRNTRIDYHSRILTTLQRGAYLSSVQQRQWWTPSRIQEWQFKQFRHTVRHAYEHIAFYHRFYNANKFHPSMLQSPSDINKIPLLTRQMVLQNYPNHVVASGYTSDNSVVRRTSGSSGISLSVLFDYPSYAYSEAIYARALFEQGVSIFDRIAYFWYEPFNRRGFWEHLGLLCKREVLYTSREREQVHKLMHIRPTVIHSFPSTLFVLSKYLEKVGARVNSPRLIITHGEVLQLHVRRKIGSVFNASVLDQYGSNEFNRMAWECPTSHLYHIDADSIVMECLRRNEPVSSNEPGEIVCSHLYNKAMPLIRYRIGDIGSMHEGKCPCGRGLPLMASIEGRKDDYLVLPHSRIISPRVIGGILERFSSVNKYHVIQRAVNHICVHVQGIEPLQESVIRAIESTLTAVIGEEVDIAVKEKPISLGRTGKIRAIESQIPVPDILWG